jgi:hypothetical protein
MSCACTQDSEESGIDDTTFDTPEDSTDMSHGELLMTNLAADELAREAGHDDLRSAGDEFRNQGYHFNDLYEDVPRINYVSECSDIDDADSTDDQEVHCDDEV